MILAVDIGGTKIAAALVEGGRIVERRSTASPIHDDYASVPEVVARLCNGWAARCEAMGIATAGLVEGERVCFMSREGRPSISLVGEVETLCGIRPVLLNDAWAGALGEYVHGDYGPAETVVYVTVSTGIGAGIVHKGELLTSANGLMAHLGHMSVRRRAEAPVACNCGRFDCVETIASGTAIAANASALLGRLVTAREVFEMEGHDRAMCHLLDEAADALAECLVNSRALLAADVFVIGGSVGLRPAFYQRLIDRMQGLPAVWAPSLRPAALGSNAELFGAAAAARLRPELTIRTI